MSVCSATWRRWLVWGNIAASMVITGCTGCDLTGKRRSFSNDEIRVGTTQEVDNLNVVLGSMAASAYIRDMAMRSGLSYMDEYNRWVPSDALAVPSLGDGAEFFQEGGKKKLRVLWEIRAQAVWGDGQPITAEDYKFTWELAMNDNVGFAGDREALQAVERYEIDPGNPKKFAIVYKTPRWDFYRGQFAVPKHIEQPIYEKHKNEPQGYDKNSRYTTDPTDVALWSGPYRVSEFKRGSHVTLVQNEKWWGQERPKLKKIIVKQIPNTATVEANLLSGEIDMANQQSLTFDQAIEFDKKAKEQNLPFTTIFEPSLTYEHIDVNLDSPVLKDQAVRKAFMYAVDRESLVQSLFSGKQQVAHHGIHPVDPWYSETMGVKYPYSEKEAVKILEEAGWKLAADGIRAKDGERLSVKFSTTAGNKSREGVQAYIKDQLKRVGFEVLIKNEPAKVFFGETMTKRRFELGMFAWISAPESPLKSQFHSSAIPSEKNAWGGQNYPGWRNAKVDELCDKMDGEFDETKRKAMASEIVQYYTSELPVIPLYYRANVVVIPKVMKGFKLPLGMYSESWHVEKWTME